MPMINEDYTLFLLCFHATIGIWKKLWFHPAVFVFSSCYYIIYTNFIFYLSFNCMALIYPGITIDCSFGELGVNYY